MSRAEIGARQPGRELGQNGGVDRGRQRTDTAAGDSRRSKSPKPNEPSPNGSAGTRIDETRGSLEVLDTAEKRLDFGDIGREVRPRRSMLATAIRSNGVLP